MVIKFAKTTQDLRFDIPTIGLTTIKTLNKAKIRVLAMQADKNLLLEPELIKEEAKKSDITIIGI